MLNLIVAVAWRGTVGLSDAEMMGKQKHATNGEIVEYWIIMGILMMIYEINEGDSINGY